MILVAVSNITDPIILMSIFVSITFISFLLHIIFRPFTNVIQNITALILEFTLICLGFGALAHEFMDLNIIVSA